MNLCGQTLFQILCILKQNVENTCTIVFIPVSNVCMSFTAMKVTKLMLDEKHFVKYTPTPKIMKT
jgi:hypothetical protein